MSVLDQSRDGLTISRNLILIHSPHSLLGRQKRTVAFPDIRGPGDDYDSRGHGVDVRHNLRGASPLQSVSEIHVW